MDKETHINKLVEDALNSTDGAGRAAPKPFLLTRIKARMDKGAATERVWGYFTRPAFVVASLVVIVGINVLAIAFNSAGSSSVSTATDQSMAMDDMSTTVATIYDIENNEP